jgi:hypothetical protein
VGRPELRAGAAGILYILVVPESVHSHVNSAQEYNDPFFRRQKSDMTAMGLRRRSTSSAAGPRRLEELWCELSRARPASATARSKTRPAARGRRGKTRPSTASRPPSALLLLPLEALTEVLRHLPPAEHLRLVHVCRQLRATLLHDAGTSPEQPARAAPHFWATVAAAHWRVDGGSRALHCRQLEVVLSNARFLCSQALRQALNVHYTTQRTAGRGPPRLERVDSNSGCPAIYRTDSPLSLALLLDREGLVQGFAIFVTVRFFVPETDSHHDVRNYLVVKKGQRIASTGGRADTGAQFRFRICGEHSELMQGIQSRDIAAAVVQRKALVQLDPRRHSVGHALCHLDVDASQAHSEGLSLVDSGSGLLLATISHTQRLIRKSHQKSQKKSARPRLL